MKGDDGRVGKTRKLMFSHGFSHIFSLSLSFPLSLSLSLSLSFPLGLADRVILTRPKGKRKTEKKMERLQQRFSKEGKTHSVDNLFTPLILQEQLFFMGRGGRK